MGNYMFASCTLQGTKEEINMYKIATKNMDEENKKRLPFPKLILAEIFSQLSPSELAISSRVCKVWLAVSLESWLWKSKLRKDCPPIFDELLLKDTHNWRDAYKTFMCSPQIFWFSPVSILILLFQKKKQRISFSFNFCSSIFSHIFLFVKI